MREHVVAEHGAWCERKIPSLACKNGEDIIAPCLYAVHSFSWKSGARTTKENPCDRPWNKWHTHRRAIDPRGNTIHGVLLNSSVPTWNEMLFFLACLTSYSPRTTSRRRTQNTTLRHLSEVPRPKQPLIRVVLRTTDMWNISTNPGKCLQQRRALFASSQDDAPT